MNYFALPIIMLLILMGAPQSQADAPHKAKSATKPEQKPSKTTGARPLDSPNTSHADRLLNMMQSGKAPQVSHGNIQPITVTGEVIDLWCYTSETMGTGRGKDHMQCAALCAAGGVPLAILDDSGDIYIAAKGIEPYKGCLTQLGTFVGKRVTVSGFVAAKKGCKALKITRVSLQR